MTRRIQIGTKKAQLLSAPTGAVLFCVLTALCIARPTNLRIIEDANQVKEEVHAEPDCPSLSHPAPAESYLVEVKHSNDLKTPDSSVSAKTLIRSFDSNNQPVTYNLAPDGSLYLTRGDCSTWVLLSGPGSTRALCQSTDSNNQSIAYCLTHNGTLYLMRGDCSTWVLLGGLGSTKDISQGVDSNDQPAAYCLTYNGILYLMRGDCSTWVLLGGPGSTKALCQSTDSNNQPVTYNLAPNGSLHLMRGDCTTWVLLSGLGSTKDISQGVDSNNQPVAYCLTHNGTLYLMRGNCSKWILLGGPGFTKALCRSTDSNNQSISYCLTHNGTLYLIKGDCSTWDLLSGSGSTKDISQGVDSNNQPVAYCLTHNGSIYLMRGNCSKWKTLWDSSKGMFGSSLGFISLRRAEDSSCSPITYALHSDSSLIRIIGERIERLTGPECIALIQFADQTGRLVLFVIKDDKSVSRVNGSSFKAMDSVNQALVDEIDRIREGLGAVYADHENRCPPGTRQHPVTVSFPNNTIGIPGVLTLPSTPIYQHGPVILCPPAKPKPMPSSPPPSSPPPCGKPQDNKPEGSSPGGRSPIEGRPGDWGRPDNKPETTRVV